MKSSANESIWFDVDPPRPRPSLRDKVETDVVVVGGGITGLTTALLLQRAGVRVVLVEAGRIACGVTGSTTAHLTLVVDARYGKLIEDFGLEGANLVAESSRAGMERIGEFVRELAIDCDYASIPGYLYSEREDDLAALHQEYEAARALRLPVELTRGVPLPFPAVAGLRFDEQARFHVRRYLLPLAEDFVTRGGRIFENSHVNQINDGETCRITTDEGLVEAKAVVSATNVPLNRFLLQTKIAHYRSYAIAFPWDASSRPLDDALFWDTDAPYHYIRTTSMAGRTYVIVGGEDHKTGQQADTEQCYARLEAYARARFSFQSVFRRWSAQVIEPMDGLPYIGRASPGSNVWVATGYGGNGMTFGTVAAMVLADRVLDRPNPWSKLYDAGRVKPVAMAREFILENADFAAYLVGDRFRAAEASSLADVGPGEGKIVGLEGRRIAVFRDSNGSLHARSPVCPHLGCLVHFNTAEKSWDCPCHGSRFDVDGEVINGPAIVGLKAVNILGPDPGTPVAATCFEERNPSHG